MNRNFIKPLALALATALAFIASFGGISASAGNQSFERSVISGVNHDAGSAGTYNRATVVSGTDQHTTAMTTDDVLPVTLGTAGTANSYAVYKTNNMADALYDIPKNADGSLNSEFDYGFKGKIHQLGHLGTVACSNMYNILVAKPANIETGDYMYVSFYVRGFSSIRYKNGEDPVQTVAGSQISLTAKMGGTAFAGSQMLTVQNKTTKDPYDNTWRDQRFMNVAADDTWRKIDTLYKLPSGLAPTAPTVAYRLDLGSITGRYFIQLANFEFGFVKDPDGEDLALSANYLMDCLKVLPGAPAVTVGGETVVMDSQTKTGSAQVSDLANVNVALDDLSYVSDVVTTAGGAKEYTIKSHSQLYNKLGVNWRYFYKYLPGETNCYSNQVIENDQVAETYILTVSEKERMTFERAAVLNVFHDLGSEAQYNRAVILDDASGLYAAAASAGDVIPVTLKTGGGADSYNFYKQHAMKSALYAVPKNPDGTVKSEFDYGFSGKIHQIGHFGTAKGTNQYQIEVEKPENIGAGDYLYVSFYARGFSSVKYRDGEGEPQSTAGNRLALISKMGGTDFAGSQILTVQNKTTNNIYDNTWRDQRFMNVEADDAWRKIDILFKLPSSLSPSAQSVAYRLDLSAVETQYFVQFADFEFGYVNAVNAEGIEQAANFVLSELQNIYEPEIYVGKTKLVLDAEKEGAAQALYVDDAEIAFGKTSAYISHKTANPDGSVTYTITAVSPLYNKVGVDWKYFYKYLEGETNCYSNQIINNADLTDALTAYRVTVSQKPESAVFSDWTFKINGAEVSDFSDLSGSAPSIEASYTQDSFTDRDFILILAAYQGDTLVKVASSPYTVKRGEDVSQGVFCALSDYVADNSITYKAMALTDMNQLTPLIPRKQISADGIQ